MSQSVKDDTTTASENASRCSIAAGIVFVLANAFVLAIYSQHSWLLLGAGQFVLSTGWYIHACLHRRGALFIFDLTWCTTFGIVAYIAFVFNRILNADLLAWGFRATFMFSAGFLSVCVIGFDDGFVLYSFERLASLFVHLMPLAVLLVIRDGNGFSDRVRASWPGYFPEAVWDETEPYHLLVAAYVPYFAWFVPHLLWLLCCGLGAPVKGYNTTFHSIYQRQVQEGVSKTLGVKSDRGHAMIWLAGHFLGASISFAFAIAVWYHSWVHSEWFAILSLCSVMSACLCSSAPARRTANNVAGREPALSSFGNSWHEQDILRGCSPGHSQGKLSLVAMGAEFTVAREGEGAVAFGTSDWATIGGGSAASRDVLHVEMLQFPPSVQMPPRQSRQSWHSFPADAHSQEATPRNQPLIRASNKSVQFAEEVEIQNVDSQPAGSAQEPWPSQMQMYNLSTARQVDADKSIIGAFEVPGKPQLIDAFEGIELMATANHAPDRPSAISSATPMSGAAAALNRFSVFAVPCRKCGDVLAPDAIFCWKCGTERLEDVCV